MNKRNPRPKHALQSLPTPKQRARSTPEQRARWAEMHSRGMSYRSIAQEEGSNYQSVMLGIKKARAAQREWEPRTPEEAVRKISELILEYEDKLYRESLFSLPNQRRGGFFGEHLETKEFYLFLCRIFRKYFPEEEDYSPTYTEEQ